MVSRKARLERPTQPAPPEMAAQLCSLCGMCCNGVLFADVELTQGDNRTQLESMRVPLAAKGRKLAFAQPCACFDGTWCRIYADRPVHCRRFECRVLQRVAAQDLSFAHAQRLIGRARARTRAVFDLLKKMGDSHDTLALTRRTARLFAKPIDLTDANQGRWRSALARAMDRLMSFLHEEFLD